MTDTPEWYRNAMATPFDEGTVDVSGVSIRYLTWGTSGRPGLVFVHGGGAHAHWWTHIAPSFADDYRIAALDLSGHGDSGRRSDYSMDAWADEVLAVADAAGIEGPPIIVGHSMGGFVTIATAARHRDHVAGIVILDSPVTRPDPENEPTARNQFANVKVHADFDTAIARFRTVPEQDHYEPFVMDHVARQSLREVEGGVSWKFDPGFTLPTRSDAGDLLPEVRCRVALFRAEHGLVTEEVGEYMYDLMGRVAPVVEIPLAGHHLMLDQPLLLITALRTLFADWNHSTPARRRA